MANDDVSLSKMNKTQLIEIVQALQQREHKTAAQRDDLAHQLNARQIRIANSGSIAEASLALSGVFESAQYAADEYVASVRAMMDDVYRASAQSAEAAEARAAQTLQQAQLDATELVTDAQKEAERIVADAQREADGILSEARNEAVELERLAENEANRIINEANAVASQVIREAQDNAKVTFGHAESILTKAKSLAAEQARVNISNVRIDTPTEVYAAETVESIPPGVTAEIPRIVAVDGASRVTPVEFGPRETLLQKFSRVTAAKRSAGGAHAQQSVVARALGGLESIKARIDGHEPTSAESSAHVTAPVEGALHPIVTSSNAAAEDGESGEGKDVSPTKADPSATVELEPVNVADAAPASTLAESKWTIEDGWEEELLEEGLHHDRVPTAKSAAVQETEPPAPAVPQVSVQIEEKKAVDPAPAPLDKASDEPSDDAASEPASTADTETADVDEAPDAVQADDAASEATPPAEAEKDDDSRVAPDAGAGHDEADADRDEAERVDDVPTDAESDDDPDEVVEEPGSESDDGAHEAANEPNTDNDEVVDEPAADPDEDEAADEPDSAHDDDEAAREPDVDTVDDDDDESSDDSSDESPSDGMNTDNWIFIDAGINVP